VCRVSLDPGSQELVGALRHHLTQFSPLYRTGGRVDDSSPTVLNTPLQEYVLNDNTHTLETLQSSLVAYEHHS